MNFREHRPDDLLTACAGCDYDPSAKSELFRKFIDEITEGDKEKALYLQNIHAEPPAGKDGFEAR